MDLILIRHPAPDIDAGVCYGRSDVPLADDATASANALVARLATLAAPLPHALWSSPLTRCASVAVCLGQYFGCVEMLDDRLQEIDFGVWERVRWDDIDRAALDAWAADLQHARVHGGESVAQFGARVREWFDARVAPTDDTCHVVTHAGVIRAIASFALRVPLEQCLSWTLDLAGIVWLRRRPGQGDWVLVRWNA
jgi:alpha-ribazole phosphatase